MQTHLQVDLGSINKPLPRVGILSLGKMGSSIVRSLSGKADFYTFLGDRSQATINNASLTRNKNISLIKRTI